MPGGAQPRDVDPEQVTSRLSEALDSCRSMMTNYRAMLGDRVLAQNNRRDLSEAERPPDAG